jgi:outer membrane protein assembly factor BamA
MRTFLPPFGILLIYCILFSQITSAQLFFKRDSLSADELNKKRVLPMVYYSNPDHVFAGLRFRIAKGRIKDNPYGMDQSIQVRYSISQNAFSLLYDAKFRELIGKWNLQINGYYDWLVWTNFFGLGNETKRIYDLTYYRLSTSEYAGTIGINRVFGTYNHIAIDGLIQGIEVLNKPGTLISQDFINNRTYYFEHHIYAGARLGYTFQYVDDPVVPTRGLMFYAGGGYTANIDETNKSFAKYSSILQLYVPLFSKFSLSLRAGGYGVTGTPEFYQYVSVGGPMTIRGFYRDRFWGNQAFYNNNELRYITNFRLGKLWGKTGLLALYDDGRVWLDNENSNTLHAAYGGGVLLAPFDKFTAMATYSKSPEGGLVQFRVTKLLTQIPARRSRFE